MRRIEMIGRKFGRLTVTEVGVFEKRHLRWKCLCDCGNIITTTGNGLRTGKAQSCGCYMIDRIKESNSKQGGNSVNENKTTLQAWRSMISRCYNKKHPKYPNYGGRGITVCERWLNSFEYFLKDMGRKPSPELSLDRYPNNESGNYEPSNCRWATIEEQQHNLRNNIWYEYNGKRMTQQDWIRELGMGRQTLIRFFKQKEK